MRRQMTRFRERVTFVVVALCLATFAVQAQQLGDQRLDAGVQEALAGKSSVRLMVRFAAPQKLRSEAGGYRVVAEDVLQGLGKAAPAPLRTFHHVPAMVINADAGVVRGLLADPRVTRIGLDAAGGGGMIEAGELVGVAIVHEAGWRGEGQSIAVVDSGVDAQHPVFAERIGPEACFCSVDGGCCPNGASQQQGGGSADDDQGHGTHVASIALGADPTAPGLAPAAELVAVKVLDDQNRFCCASDVVAALDWVLQTQPEVGVVNLSLGTDATFPYRCDASTAWTASMADAVDALSARGTLVIAAAMNQGETDVLPAPACLSGVVSVGAVWSHDAGRYRFQQGGFSCSEEARQDQITCFSNTSGELDLLAPGAPIRAAAPGGGTAVRLGTSMAAPVVAGCTALAREVAPQASAIEIIESMTQSGQLIEESGTQRLFPRLDCAGALARLDNAFGTDPVEPKALSGSWYDPARNGEGWVLEVLENGSAVVIWFTYDLDGKPLWLLGSRGEVDGQRIVFDELKRTSGPLFGSLFDPDDFTSEPFGSLELLFEDCDNGQVSWQAPPSYGNGSTSITRLTRLAGLSCEAASAQ